MRGESVRGESVRGESVRGESVRGESVRGECVRGEYASHRVDKRSRRIGRTTLKVVSPGMYVATPERSWSQGLLLSLTMISVSRSRYGAIQWIFRPPGSSSRSQLSMLGQPMAARAQMSMIERKGLGRSL